MQEREARRCTKVESLVGHESLVVAVAIRVLFKERAIAVFGLLLLAKGVEGGRWK